MAVRLRVFGVEVQRIEMQGQRREKGIVGFIDGAAPMMFEDLSDGEVLEGVAPGFLDRLGEEGRLLRLVVGGCHAASVMVYCNFLGGLGLVERSVSHRQWRIYAVECC